MKNIIKIKSKKDTQSRKWLLTINNPIENGNFTHDKIKEELTNFKSIIYYCMADETGLETGTPHTHLYIVFSSGVRWSTVKKHFPSADIESALGNSQQNYEYISKTGKWSDDSKADTSVEGSFEEWGEMPVEHQGARNDLNYLYDKIKDGCTDIEILDENPDFMRDLNNIERVRQKLKAEEYKNKFRELETIFIYGETEAGKTRYVMEKYGYENVYSVTDYIRPFDDYNGEYVMLFDEFEGKIRIQKMNQYLDGYPLKLPARYTNKQACYEKIYIISNIELRDLYKSVQDKYPKVWNAFTRRIHKVIHFQKDGERNEYDTQDYLKNKDSEDKQINIVELPFDGDCPF